MVWSGGLHSANFIRVNSAASLGPALSIAVTLMSSEICERAADSNLFRGILRKGRNGRRVKRREIGNEQSESNLLECQRCVRSNSDAPLLQAQKDQNEHKTQKTLVPLLEGSFLSFPRGCLFTRKRSFV